MIKHEILSRENDFPSQYYESNPNAQQGTYLFANPRVQTKHLRDSVYNVNLHITWLERLRTFNNWLQKSDIRNLA